MTETIRLFLLDDEQHVRHGLRMRLEMEPGFEVVGEAGDGCAAPACIRSSDADVVLMDIDMPGKDGIAVLRELMAGANSPAVVMVSMHDDAATRTRALAAGAAGFVGKHEIDSTLIEAIRLAARRQHCRGERKETN